MADERKSVPAVVSPEEGAILRSGYPSPVYPDYSSMGYGEGAAPDAFQLREIWRRILKHRWLILSLAVIITTVATIEVFRTKSIYQATATIEMDQSGRTMVRQGDVVIQTEETANVWELPLLMKTKIRVLQSRPLQEDVVVALRLDQNPKFLDITQKRSVWDAVRQIASLGESAPLPGNKSAGTGDASQQLPEKQTRSSEESERLSPFVSVLSQNLSAAPLEETRMLEISYKHTDPALAAQIANTAAQSFILRTFQNKTEKYTNASEWLDRSTRELKSRVEQAEQALANYSRDHNIISIEGKENLTAEKLSRMHDQMMRAETDRLIKESLYEEVRQGRSAQLPEAFANNQTNSLQNRLDELKTSAAQLNTRFGPDHPRVIEIQTQLKETEARIVENRLRLEEKLKADFDRAVRDEQEMRNVFNRAKAEAVDQNQAAIQYSLLKQNVDTNKALYNEFLQKTAQAKIEVAEQHSNMRVIDPAVTPLAPIGPKRMRAILISLFLSLVAGIALALAIEFFDNSIRSAEDVARFIQLPLLAVIPTIATKQARLLNPGGAFKKLLSSSSTGSTASTASTADEQTISLNHKQGESLSGDTALSPVVAFVRNSTVSEAYRMLRTSVMLSTAGGPPKTLLFTSGQPGEGKTTTTINTAVALARQGASVIIVDADLRRPMIHKLFNVESRKGLSTWLSRDVALDDLIQTLPIQNLSLLPCGPIPPNPAELVGAEKMKTLIRELSERYDHVLIDSPPVVHVTDPVVLSTLVDGVLLVVSGGKTTKQIVRRVRQELSSVNARMLGVVLNNVDMRRDGYNDYYYYRYYSNSPYANKGEVEEEEEEKMKAAN